MRLNPDSRRLVPRPPHGLRVCRQPGRCEAGPLLVQRHQQRHQLGRGLGRDGVARLSRAGWRSSGFRFRSCGSRRRTRTRSASPWSRDVGRLHATSTWPLLARSANGYVSSFGELGRGDDRPGGEAAGAHAVHRRQPDASAHASGNPLIDSASAGTSFGVDMKYALTPGLTLTASRESGFRAGRGRPRDSQPVGVRDVLQRAAAVLRGGVGQLPVRRRLLRRLQQPVLLAAHRPLARTAHSRCRADRRDLHRHRRRRPRFSARQS